MNYEEMPNRPIMCIDMKCFYASCIAMLHGIDILETPVAVVANFDQPGSVVLAASPLMKEKYKIKTGSRRFEIPKHPDIQLFEPKMSFFIQMSMTITKLIANYVPVDAIHVYSVDESFVDLTGTEKLWGSPEQAAREIQAAILDQYNVPSAVGLGPNMLMAKLALDLEAKKTGFAQWTYGDIPKKLWPVRPLSEMWGIGKQMEANLNKMGIQTVGGLANADLNDLEEQFGVMGNQLYHHAWGIDLSKLGEPLITNGALSFGKGQMLMRDYHTRKDLSVVLLEMCEDVMKRARDAGFVGRTISLGLSYSRNAMTKGFHRSRTIDTPTNETLVMYKTCIELLDEHFAGEPARQLSVRISNLEREHSIQLDLFDERKPQRQLIGPTMDAIRNRFGATALLRAVSFTGAGTAIKRDRLVGGHLA
ncbi:UV damage repair protein UvrX [Lysinibacillus sp. FSL M8-0216]|uniref:DNA polymerase V n=1 Tax=Lysinibacillus fusiformis TaxID=28031 RepID=A0A1H9RV97_9BACI|nr:MULTISPECIES: UV-damage repair protein uvrX [Lysinibacillus]EAZ85642.1 UvrX [Bacillus sp. B14905]HAU35732.1 UV damage repair protein UvrX [Lysinibacillus sp.]MCG7435297.1 UV damage repair protein UvrX [Lysinibacillus fusiformis]MED4078108.1 UV damage repair protein UvrX [Lysinibacillus fusiformis]MED4670175.1 UV damage repair protein UvrX [Lysinibacillus fusiformis]